MAPVEEKMREVLRRIKADTNSVRVQVSGNPALTGELPLSTNAKNLVDAVNEVKALAEEADSAVADPGDLASLFQSY